MLFEYKGFIKLAEIKIIDILGSIMKRFVIILAILSLFSFLAKAEDTDYSFATYWENLKNNVNNTWNSSRYDIYLPFYAWHNRLTYDQDHLDKYNEEAWGFGLGKSYYDRKGNWHGLYAMAFKDSNFYLETIFGYAYMKNWFVNCRRDFSVGVGYTLSLTQRHEYSYIPVPLPLPIAGITYKQFSLQAAYVPGIKNDGNVLFMWLRYAIN